MQRLIVLACLLPAATALAGSPELHVPGEYATIQAAAGDSAVCPKTGKAKTVVVIENGAGSGA